MICTHCGTEIADRALTCYRCGTATSEPVDRPPDTSSTLSSRWVIPLALGLVFLGAAGFFIAQSASGGETSPLVWVMLAAAGVLLSLRLWRL